MQFRVVPPAVADTSYNPAAVGGDPCGPAHGPAGRPRRRHPGPGRGGRPEPPADAERGHGHADESVNGIAYPGGPLEILVNNTSWDGFRRPAGHGHPDLASGRTSLRSPSTAITDVLFRSAQEGDTKIWEIVNLTADAHPMHTHLVQFQILNRQTFDVAGYTPAYDAASFPSRACTSRGSARRWTTTRGNPLAVGGNPDVTPFLKGRPAACRERGRLEGHHAVPPGTVTRFVVRWAPIELATNLDPQQYFYPVRPGGPGLRLRLALPHRRPRGQRDDAAHICAAEVGSHAHLRPGRGLLTRY